MRKLQQVALVIAAAGGLTAVGAGPSSAVTPAYNGAVPPPASQPDAQATSATSAAATAQSYGTPQQAPSRGTDVAPQLNPQLNPQINPQISPQTPQSVEGGPVGQANLFRPSQECSPQTLLGANVPVGLLGAAQTRGIDCTQANTQSNALANALHG
ncbi:hypothetical protein BIV25_23210 [Streptomyces sp. MUSC 14]|uniref:hypothetical protein n=1 Tax=Streptomyces sp. MUSC 14 TaxID=1354889 RepID=UPI0008F55BF5|nr:hypothetical protein [Streptomyces sp. MUSC 14]OIJ94190.1 hypothetical protein BIV25_23210 [Streptomyces sp. MUSC 14]